MRELQAVPPKKLPWAWIIACAAIISGVGAAVGGVYLLAGAGWALLTVSVSLFVLASIVLRGLLRG